ncbi:diguanylate cyclase (GGDEF) domain [Clostridium sp. CAG:122]|uniref:GGDEF domain-containing response regulator n=1 Tax=Butyribacter sp. TaxID=2822465 RepID=UPI00033CA7A7|nr:diguanylate cyclase [Roseburia hominis]CCZ42746.1 diguanylate cyclase (GGDEF) domain [Clostridium sp. CAG:122]
MKLQKKEKLLIVDDSRFQRVVFREMLAEKFEILEAVDGKECLEIIKKNGNNIDIVLLDLVMPNMDGFEVLRKRQTIKEFESIPVIALTTSNEISFQTEAFELGANDFIMKPVDARIAISRINNTLESVRHLKKVLEEQNSWKLKSQIDEMTHLFNKITTEKMVTSVLSEFPQKKQALIVVDIDNFKSVNDILGHKVGDHIICVVAGVLSSLFRNTDIIGRIGGDEFVVLMRNVPDYNVVTKKAAQLIDLFENKEGLSIPENISVSVGIAFSDDNDRTFSDLFSKSDQALYMSKKSGKACFSIYGMEYDNQNQTKEIILLSDSRNIVSTLEYALPNFVKIKNVKNLVQIDELFNTEKNVVAGIYIDTSELCENELEQFWNDIKKKKWIGKYPITAICKEGELKQMRYAVTTDGIYDMVLSPIDAGMIKRRVRKYIDEEKQRNKI